MVLRTGIAAALLAGCYSPSVAPGAPCSESGACPSGQECRAGTCFAVGAPHDGGDDPDAEPDGPTTDASPDGPTYIPWGTAIELNSLEATATGEGDPSFTADKLTVVFSAFVASDQQLFIATRLALTDTFTITELTVLNAATFSDRAPEISADGKTIFFVSNRSGGNEIYVSTFTTDWSLPTVRTDLSTAGNDESLAISPDGLTAVVSVAGAPNRFRIHTRATTSAMFGAGVMHSELEVTTDIGGPTITNGGDVIYLHAGNPRQLYRATKKGNGTYTTPVLVTELNVAATRTATPYVDQNDEYMWFEVAGDIFQTTRDLP